MNRGRDGLHLARIRAANERGIIAAIRQGGAMTKTELADELGLTRQAVNIIVGDMVSGGLLREGGRKTGGVGRSSTYYALDAMAAFSIGIALEADRVEAILVDFLGSIHYRATIATGAGGRDVLPLAALEGAASAIRGHCDAAGIAPSRLVGVCGVVPDFSLDGAADGMQAPVAVQAALAKAFGLPAQVEHRAAAAAAAELARAEGALPPSFAFLSCDSGISAALVLDGTVRPGDHGRAMRIGRLPVAGASGQPPTLLEDVASTAVLRGRLLAAGVAADDFYAANLARPDLVEAWMAEAGAGLGRAIAAVHLTADIGAAIIDIGLPAGPGHRLVERASAALAGALPLQSPVPQVLRSRLGRDAALLGAAVVPLNARFGEAGAGGKPSARAKDAADARPEAGI